MFQVDSGVIAFCYCLLCAVLASHLGPFWVLGTCDLGSPSGHAAPISSLVGSPGVWAPLQLLCPLPCNLRGSFPWAVTGEEVAGDRGSCEGHPGTGSVLETMESLCPGGL